MNRTAVKFALGAAILALAFQATLELCAQAPAATLSGTVTGPLDVAVAHATVSVKNLATGQSTDTRTDSVGTYKVTNLAPGDYEVSVSAEGFNTQTTKARLVAGANQTTDVALSTVSSHTGEPSLQDLGFSPNQVQGNAQEQARLNKRSHMLKVHQELGLITAVPLFVSVLTGPGAKGHHRLPGSPSGRELHAALGAATAGLYFTSAYFAIRAPKIHGTEVHGPIRVHKALAWIHGPGMILTPILGAIAYSQENRGERVHGIAKAHGAVAVVTAAAYGAAILSVSVKF